MKYIRSLLFVSVLTLASVAFAQNAGNLGMSGTGACTPQAGIPGVCNNNGVPYAYDSNGALNNLMSAGSSGGNADTVDFLHASAFLLVGGTAADSARLGAQVPTYYSPATHLHTGAYAPFIHTHNGADITSGTVGTSYLNNLGEGVKVVTTDLTVAPSDGPAYFQGGKLIQQGGGGGATIPISYTLKATAGILVNAQTGVFELNMYNSRFRSVIDMTLANQVRIVVDNGTAPTTAGMTVYAQYWDGTAWQTLTTAVSLDTGSTTLVSTWQAVPTGAKSDALVRWVINNPGAVVATLIGIVQVQFK